MARLTPAGLIFCALCFISQVLCQSTEPPGNSTTLAGNQTVNNTTPNTFGGQTNGTTAPTGAGAHTQAGALYVLVPVAMVASLLPRGC